VVLPMLKSDLAEIMLAAVDGQLDQVEVENQTGSAATVVMASGGYPGSYAKGMVISGLDSVAEATVFHAGTKLADGQIVTSGGRVLAVTGIGDNLQQALDSAYEGVRKVNFEKAEFRTDIGQSSIENN